MTEAVPRPSSRGDRRREVRAEPGEPNHAGGFGSALDLLPQRRSLPALRTAAADCRACRLYRNATQTVFGEGTREADVVMVGEQPGDQEDRSGRPFVGPAGRLLDRALAEAGIDRRKVYVTNAVKHFKWVAKGKRRIHKRPASEEIGACRPWLDAELSTVGPKVVVCLGATAAQAVLGRSFRVTQHRGEFVSTSIAPWVTATVHPSSILRAPEEEDRRAEMAAFVADLRVVARKLREGGARSTAAAGG